MNSRRGAMPVALRLRVVACRPLLLLPRKPAWTFTRGTDLRSPCRRSRST